MYKIQTNVKGSKIKNIFYKQAAHEHPIYFPHISFSIKGKKSHEK